MFPIISSGEACPGSNVTLSGKAPSGFGGGRAPPVDSTPTCFALLALSADREAFVKTVPMGRLNTPEDLANAALFLASDDAAMVTGTVFEVDGGRCI